MYDQTGLTVMEVEVPTGYVAVNDVLREYVQSGEVPNLGRAEYKNNRLFFYIDYVSQINIYFQKGLICFL